MQQLGRPGVFLLLMWEYIFECIVIAIISRSGIVSFFTCIRVVPLVLSYFVVLYADLNINVVI
jgi:hypothetical protein